MGMGIGVCRWSKLLIYSIREADMHRRIFDNKLIYPALSLIAKGLIKFGGWKIVGQPPAEKKYIIIAAPHTSNWDFYWCMTAAIASKWPIYWVGKHSLFKGIAKPLLTWLGGIPIDRKHASNAVDAYCELIAEQERISLVIAPEGTRSLQTKWKTGFYRIAIQAKIPIALGFADFKKKEVGFGFCFKPCGDYSKDISIIHSFYKQKTPKYPENFGFDQSKNNT